MADKEKELGLLDEVRDGLHKAGVELTKVQSRLPGKVRTECADLQRSLSNSLNIINSIME